MRIKFLGIFTAFLLVVFVSDMFERKLYSLQCKVVVNVTVRRSKMQFSFSVIPVVAVPLHDWFSDFSSHPRFGTLTLWHCIFYNVYKYHNKKLSYLTFQWWIKFDTEHMNCRRISTLLVRRKCPGIWFYWVFVNWSSVQHGLVKMTTVFVHTTAPNDPTSCGLSHDGLAFLGSTHENQIFSWGILLKSKWTPLM